MTVFTPRAGISRPAFYYPEPRLACLKPVGRRSSISGARASLPDYRAWPKARLEHSGYFMQTFVWLLSLSLSLAHFSTVALPGPAPARQPHPQAKQLHAVRGEIVRKKKDKGAVLITVRPAREYAEVTVVARENDLVGVAEDGPRGQDLFGLLAGDPRDEEELTAAELDEGDVVSIIYDPLLQNRALEIYLH
jgi:hypothetical protein